MAPRCRGGGGREHALPRKGSGSPSAASVRAPQTSARSCKTSGWWAGASAGPRAGNHECWAGRRKKQCETSPQTLVGTTAAPANLHLIRLGSPLVSAALRSHHAVAAVRAALMRALGPPGLTLERAPGLQTVQACMGGGCKGRRGASAQAEETAAGRFFRFALRRRTAAHSHL